MTKGTLTSIHWGTYRVESQNGVPCALHSCEDEPNPSPIGDAILDTLSGPCRFRTPVMRRGFLEDGATCNRIPRYGQINSGGVGQHTQADGMRVAREAGIEFVNVSPDRSDIAIELDAEWVAVNSNTDIALMLVDSYTTLP